MKLSFYTWNLSKGFQQVPSQVQVYMQFMCSLQIAIVVAVDHTTNIPVWERPVKLRVNKVLRVNNMLKVVINVVLASYLSIFWPSIILDSSWFRNICVVYGIEQKKPTISFHIPFTILSNIRIWIRLMRVSLVMLRLMQLSTLLNKWRLQLPT